MIIEKISSGAELMKEPEVLDKCEVRGVAGNQRLEKNQMLKWLHKVAHRLPVSNWKACVSVTYSLILKPFHTVPLCPTWSTLIVT